MLKKFCIIAILFSFSVLLTAMGGKGGFERAPRVEKNYPISVGDALGNRIDGEQFSWEGRIHFEGYMGLAQVTVPFDKVRELTVGEKHEKKVKVTLRFKDGGEALLEMDADARCFGEAGFGSFMLTMDEIKSINFK